MLEKESDVAERLFDAIKNEDKEAIDRGLSDFASMGWKMSVVYRFITRNNDKVSCIYNKGKGVIFLVNTKFDLEVHKKYIDLFERAREDRKVFDEHFRSREEMTEEERKWIFSTTEEEISEFKKYL